MELKRPEFPLLNETLSYLEADVVGTLKNLVRIKNYKFLIHMKLQNCERINNDEINMVLLNEEIIPLSNVQPGSLLGCLHPRKKKWMRCYVVSLLNREAYVALCDTGEMTKTKKLKDIPIRYKSIPVITFEAEVPCVCPNGKLRHLIKNFEDYIVTFEPFMNKQNNKTHKKMKLTYKNSRIDLIIKQWDLQSYMNIDDTNYDLLMFKNGSTVTVGKLENYDWRHIFVRSADRFVNVCKELQIYCKNALGIQIDPIIGDIIAVKCIDKYYRGKIIDVIDETNCYLYLIDTGYVISASIDCIVNLSETLKKIPPTVCLVGLKDINLKPWTPETVSYITTLFENSTAMIMEYTDFDIFGLDSVTLTIINNNQDVNGHLNELLEFVEDSQKDNKHASLNFCYDSMYKSLQTTRIIPIKMDNFVRSDSLDMSENIENLPSSGSLVFMTGFVSLNEIYIRRSEDYNDEFDKFINTVNNLCSSVPPINRPLVIGEIIGALSPLDNTIYRGKVLKEVNHNTYLIQYIDFGDKDNVSLSNIFQIPKDLTIPASKVMKITLKGVKPNQMNIDTSNYISNLMSDYVPMTIELSSKQSLNDVILTTVCNNENVNQRVNELLNNSCSFPIEVINQSAPENNEGVPKLKNGDLVFIELFIDVHNIFVRKVEDKTDEFLNFIEHVHSYCSAEAPIGKFPKVDDIIGAKSITDGFFYRAKVLKKVNDASYNVQFIDYGIKENVSLSDIVSLSTEIKQVIPTVILVKLKGVPFHVLNEVAREYVSYISEKEYLKIDVIENNTNEVILKTEENENVNDHLNMFESNCIAEKSKISDFKEVEKDLKMYSSIESSLSFHRSSLEPGDIVYMTAFVDLNEMYIRKLEDYNDDYHNFLDEVDKYCLLATPINRPLKIGEIIGAQSTLDNSFYRGQVLKKNDDATYLIQYIDFGDKDNVPLSNIFVIPPQFMIPTTVIKINLKGIKSNVLNIEASNYITTLLSTYEPMTVDFNPELPLKDVTLIVIKSNENVIEILNKLLQDVNNTECNSIQCVDNAAVNDILRDNVHYEANLLEDGDLVYITAYVDLYNIFVRKVNDNNEELQKLLERVNTFCSLGNTSESKPLELDQIIGAKCSIDGFFYRARIIKKTDEKNYDLTFIDFGFEENVNVADIVPLPIQLQQVKSSIHLVGLKGSIFKNLNMEGHKYLESLMILSEVMKIEFKDLNAVSLTVINQEQNVMDYLNKLYLDSIEKSNTIMNNSVEPSSEMKCIPHEISIPQIPPLTNKSIVTIHTFVSLKSIYIMVPFDKSNFNKFLKDFSEFCSTSPPITRNPTVGDIFGIRSSIDGSFNRGAVLKKLNENQFKVIYFDLGIEDNVSVNSFVEIPESLKQVPRTIYSVGLKDVHSQNLNAQAMSYVNMLCDNMPLSIEFDENCPNGFNAVTLTTVETQQNINYHLAKLLTEKERDSPEMVHMLSKGDIVYISTFEDLQTIYIRRINNGTDKFKSFLEKFSSSCELENPMEKDPEVGEIIAAKGKSGNKFYRAEVISKMDDEHFNVCFIDFGSWETVHRSNIVQPSELQLQYCSPTFMVGLFGLGSEPIKDTIMQYIKKIIQTETFIIDSITEQNKVVLISVNTQYNINKEIERIIYNGGNELKMQSDMYACNDDANTEKSILKYYIPPLEVPIQVWIAEKISSSKYSVHTYNSRIEFMQLEKQMFEDSKQFVSIKCIEINKPCIVYFSPSWYRGEILEVIDRVTAKIGLVDVGNFSVTRNIKEIFHMPSKYKGKTLLLNIEVQPEPQEHLSITTFKVIAKKQLDNITIVELVDSPPLNQSYDDLENVGLPSFSSTPIPEDSGKFQYSTVNDKNVSTILCSNPLSRSPSYNTSPNKRFSNILTIKDVQYAKWPMGSSKMLTFLNIYQDYLVMRDHMIDDALADLEAKIQNYCMSITSYCPVENELCLAKYNDGLWYRAICIKTATLKDSNYTIYFLDWGIEYFINAEEICKMSKDFVYLPATAHKCFIKGSSVLKWNNDTIEAVSQLMLTQLNCEIVEKVTTDTYIISCDSIKNLIDLKLGRSH